jgi:hypothetical protein
MAGDYVLLLLPGPLIAELEAEAPMCSPAPA